MANDVAARAPAWEPMQADHLLTQEDYALIKGQLAKDLTDQEFKLFLYECKRRGVHPSDRLLIPTVYSKTDPNKRRVTYIVTVDLLRAKADESRAYAGNDEPVFTTDEDGEDIATVTVWKLVSNEAGQYVRCPFTASARWSEYAPENAERMWKKMPKLMLGKCAEALALRKAFPRELHGLYVKEEMGRDLEELPPRKDVARGTLTGMKPAPPGSHTDAAAPAQTTAESPPIPPTETVAIGDTQWRLLVTGWREDERATDALRTICKERSLTNALQVTDSQVRVAMRDQMSSLGF